MTRRRKFTKMLPLLGDVDILVMSGAQRDTYIQNQLLLRQNLAASAGLSLAEYNALSEEERAEKATAALQGSTALTETFNEQQYMLILWCFVSSEGDPVYKTIGEVSGDLDYEQATELAKACAEVNRLLPEQEKEAQHDFFETQKKESGTD